MGKWGLCTMEYSTALKSHKLQLHVPTRIKGKKAAEQEEIQGAATRTV